MRLFIALNIPEGIKDRIADEILPLVPKRDFKAVEKENLHVTLGFIGESDEGRMEKIKKGLEKINYKKFNARIKGAGNFGTRVLWLGIEEGAQEISEIAKLAMDRAGMHDEKQQFRLFVQTWAGGTLFGRMGTTVVPLTGNKQHTSGYYAKFHPHITLARNRDAKPAEFYNVLEKASKAGFVEEFEAKAVSLMESTLTPAGARYREIYRKEFS